MTGPTVHVDTDLPSGGQGTPAPPLEAIARALRATLADEGARGGEVSLTLVGDDRIRALNRDYLGHDRVTDVISFSLQEPGDTLLADIYIGHAQALRQAAELALPARHELVRLAIHGTLHALGYDHPSEDRFASEFFHRQEKLVNLVLASEDGAREDGTPSSTQL